MNAIQEADPEPVNLEADRMPSKTVMVKLYNFLERKETFDSKYRFRYTFWVISF